MDNKEDNYMLLAGSLVGFLVYRNMIYEETKDIKVVYVDEVWVHSEWRRLGLGGGMIRKAAGVNLVELMVRMEGRKGKEAECNPELAYTRIGLKPGKMGSGGNTTFSGYEGEKGCVFMHGRVRRDWVPRFELQELGLALDEIEGWETLERAGFGSQIVKIVMMAHGLSMDEACNSIKSSGESRYMVLHH
jgi:hypothetical protein